MEKWTPRELREFRAAVMDARSRERRVGEDVHWRGLGPIIVQVSESPSFGAASIWDIRRFNDALKLYVSTASRARPGFLEPGYRELAIGAEELEAMLAAFAAARLQHLLPAAPVLGLDGTQFGFAFRSGMSAVRLSWWQDGPAEWQDLTRAVCASVGAFKGLAEGAGPPLPPDPALTDPS